MLRKLFIGLIILSALTTEGLIDTSWNIYNLCLFVNNASSFSNDAKNSLQSLENNLESDVSLPDLVFDNRLFTETKGIAQIKYDLSIKPFLEDNSATSHPYAASNADDRCDFEYSNISFLHNRYHGLDKEIILSISDVSPPSFC